MLDRENAVEFYRTSAVEYLFGEESHENDRVFSAHAAPG